MRGMDAMVRGCVMGMALGCAAGSASVTGVDATVGADASDAVVLPEVSTVDVATWADTVPAPRCGDGECTAPSETCTTCPLDCGACPMCNMAPSCTGALAVPTSSMALDECSNVVGGTERTNYACGTDLGVSPGATTCADPKLRLRIQQMSIRQGFFDLGQNLYCVVTAEDGTHSELLLTPPSAVAGNQNTTAINLPLSQAVFWGQGDLYRSISDITVTYKCYLASNAAAAQSVLNDIANRAGMAAEHADGYGWVFGTVSVLGTILGSSLGAISDSNVLDVQQTLAAGALLDLTNGRTWVIHHQRGNLSLSGASDLDVTIQSWGCADVRTTTP